MPPRWLPDWQNPAQYPNPAQASRVDWAWEFLRRNPDYQRLWSHLIKPSYKRAHVKFSWRHVVPPAQLVSNRIRPYLHCTAGNYPLAIFRARFGIVTVPPNPSEPKPKLRFDPEVIRYARKPLKRGGTPPAWTYSVTANLQDHEVLIWFDLRWPIEAQLKSAKKLLKQQINQNLPKGNQFQFRIRPQQYARYLRLLDAKIAGATNAQVAHLIYPRLPNTYTNPAGSRQVRRDRAIATSLRDNPWRIVARGK